MSGQMVLLVLTVTVLTVLLTHTVTLARRASHVYNEVLPNEITTSDHDFDYDEQPDTETKDSADHTQQQCGCGPLTGPPGAPGIPGVPGMHGMRGQDGQRGEKGDIGPKGDTGSHGQYSLSAVDL